MHQVESEVRRRDLLARLELALAQKQTVSADYDAGAITDAHGAAAVEDALRRIDGLYEEYEATLPRLAVSRCPFTGEVVRMAMDVGGLDGPWWDSEGRARPADHFPETVFAVTGAVNLGEAVPNTPFLCRPGPAVPYVVPRLLVNREIRAVVSSLEVADWNAYAIVYFAEETPYDIARMNTWGLDHYVAGTVWGGTYRLSIADHPDDFDFDLAFYIGTGRLLWIAPDDATITLRSGLDDCPYLDLPGRRYPVGLQHGEMWNCLIA